MTEPNQTADAREAGAKGGKPDQGCRSDALTEALSGSGVGSDTRAGSLEGGAATGSDIDPDQATIDAALAKRGQRSAADPAVG